MNTYIKKYILILTMLGVMSNFDGCATLPAFIRPHTSSQVTEEMLKDAYSHNDALTDNARLVDFLKKAADKQPLTVGYFGGSITEGYYASEPDKCYANRVQEYFEQSFPETDFTYVNAGIAGTGSGIGVHRVGDDMLSYEPDLVIIDAAVNDNNTDHYKETYENLVRRVLLSESEPAVILLFMVEETGTCATEVESEIGAAYHLPMIDYGAAVSDMLSDGTVWSDIAEDYVHPNDTGHEIAASLITTYINDVYKDNSNFFGKIMNTDMGAALETNGEPEADQYPIVTSYRYQNGRIYDMSEAVTEGADNPEGITILSFGSFKPYSGNERFPNGLISTEGSEPLVFTVNARNIGFMLERSELEQSGLFDVEIDGEHYSLNTFCGFVVNDAIVYTSDETRMHTVKITRSTEYPDGVLTILGFLIS